MFTSPLSWLPTWLLSLFFASTVLTTSGNRSPNTQSSYDPFHAMAALAPKPSEEPICCLNPLTALEPVDDDLFLSFEDWKAKRSSESNNNNNNNNLNSPPNVSATPTRNPADGPAEFHVSPAADVHVHVSDTPDTAAPTVQSVEGAAAAIAAVDTPTTPASPHFRVPLTDRFNYASWTARCTFTRRTPRPSQHRTSYPRSETDTCFRRARRPRPSSSSSSCVRIYASIPCSWPISNSSVGCSRSLP